MRNLFNLISVNKYYQMSDGQLEEEARRWNIRAFGNNNGTIERQIIIDALLKKDNANNSRYAIIISVVAILISIVLFIQDFFK